ncbi:hypothetical protein BDF20DRAFT_896061 [Mycotypha africana]|uniref:uncharacterized protein n=1 Tax=Mycotypha africana TaxID=64632 RepID=UPI002300BBA2|nr:uncharacterized protein BDF20DRAFT_896061 [Mycotypha africana]KAI8968385.1 hypothetical protein BDF20DRAFT_896061 [Mycotypha africana]
MKCSDLHPSCSSIQLSTNKRYTHFSIHYTYTSNKLMASPSSSTAPVQRTSTKKRSKVSRRELETLNDNNSKKARRDLPKCSICEYRIEPQYWAEHYQYELSRLAETTSEVYTDPLNKNKGKRGAAVLARKHLEGKGRTKKPSAHEETIDRIRKNRSKRAERINQIQLNGSSSSSSSFHVNFESTDRDSEVALQMMQEEEAAAAGGDEIQTCFICNERLYGDLEAINLHIDNCLSNQNNNDTDEQEEEEEDVGLGNHSKDSSTGDNTLEELRSNNDTGAWEEYEWAGHRRVRATALMEGGYGGAGFATASKVEVDDDDEDLDVEDDDAAQYGESQYTERDILVNENDEDANALREMVSGGITRSTSAESNGRRLGFEETVSDAGWEAHLKSEDALASDDNHSSLLIDSLKARIRELEKASKSNNCLICLEPYKTPLTSIVCWHVHCEECWLRTLGSKKLCPQCQKITTPADLRRIYF